jgi:nucleotide-binding universal stress UspA family protein
MQRRIVIGLDPRRGGDDALALGRLLAEVLAATPVVATVSAWPAHLLGPDDLAKAIELDTREHFARAGAALAGLDPEFRALPRTSPAEALNELAESERALAIALASAHPGPLGRTGIGSVGESLLQGAPCAIAVAPAGYGERPSHELGRVAAAYDGSPESATALTSAVALAERTHARLTVLTVAEFPHYGFATALSVLTEAEYRDSEREQKQALLDRALGNLPPELGADGRLCSGAPGETLASESGDFDLLVTGSRGYGPVRRTLLGSATRELLSRSSCPVLVLARGITVEPLGWPASASPERG